MELKHPFSASVRELYRDVWQCWVCRQNGTQRGGLELHHILGRVSGSALNSALLCHQCHSGMCHSIEEEQALFYITLKFLYARQYQLNADDNAFVIAYGQRVFSEKALAFIKA